MSGRMIRSVLATTVSQLGDDEVEVVMATSDLARDGHVLVAGGCDLQAYRTNPIILWQHDPNHPVATSPNVTVDGDKITARIRFAPIGISHKADEVRGLVKAGVINAVSVGWDTLECEPLDPKRPRGGQRITKWALLECSFVSVPADTGAVVTARQIPTHKEVAIMADNSELRIRLRKRLFTSKTPELRGMYELASLCYMLESLGYAKNIADWEKAIEGDDSQVPALLGEALVSLGTALTAMAAEEVSELLDNAHMTQAVEDEISEGSERTWLRAAKTDRARTFRAALLKLRAGKAISAANAAQLSDAVDKHKQALTYARSASSNHATAAKHHDALGEAHAKLRSMHGKITDAVTSAQDAPTADNVATIAKRCAAMGDMMDTMDAEQDAVQSALDDAADAVTGNARCVRSAQACVRSVLAADQQDEDTTDVQTSAGDGTSEGAADGRSLTLARRRKRAAELRQAV